MAGRVRRVISGRVGSRFPLEKEPGVRLHCTAAGIQTSQNDFDIKRNVIWK